MLFNKRLTYRPEEIQRIIKKEKAEGIELSEEGGN